MRRPLVLVLLLPALLLPACGDGGGSAGSGEDEKKIVEVITTGVTSKDEKATCATLSPALLKRLYETAAHCQELEAKEDSKQGQADSVKVSGVKIDGERATATVVLSGGDHDGAHGQLGLAAEGEDWRVDDLSVAFLRSELETSMRSDTELTTAVKDCIVKRVFALDDADLKKLAYDAIGERPAAVQQLVTILTECDEQSSSASGDDSPSFLRKKFEEGVAQSLRDSGTNDAGVACVTRALRKRISDKQIVDLVGKGGEDVPAELTAAVAAALADCKATT